MTESEILYNNFMNVSKCMERLQFLSMRDDELDNNLKKMKPFQEKSSKKAFTIVVMIVNSPYINYNKNGAANLEKKKNDMMAEQEKNKQEALDIYKEIREYLRDHVPQEYRNVEDLRNLAQYFKNYDLMSIPDAIALYEKDLKAGVYDKKGV